MSNFKVGQKVVCVDNSGNNSLIKDKIYTIAQLTVCIKCAESKLILKEKAHPNDAVISICRCRRISKNINMFRSSRFRPIKEQPSKISNVIDNKQVIKELATEKSDVKIKEKV